MNTSNKALLGALLLVVGTGCAGSGSDASDGSEGNGAESDITAGGPDRCHTNELRLVAIGNIGVATGHWEQRFGLVNESQRSCSFLGYPGMGLKARNGGDMPTNVVRLRQGQGFFGVGSNPTKFVLKPNERASFRVEGTDVPIGSESCKASASLIVTPPDETTQVQLDFSLTACDHGELDVSPMLPP